MNMYEGLYILGAGATGLGAAYVSGIPVLESDDIPGGICASYYIGYDGVRRPVRGNNEELYRFEKGGGHWIFGGDPEIRQIFGSFQELAEYERKAAVYLKKYEQYLPYPIQANLQLLPRELRVLKDQEIPGPHQNAPVTMSDWLQQEFGETLYSAFFQPFHELYTAGLFQYIAPQDAFKSPRRDSDAAESYGYNSRFLYPRGGLSALFRSIADSCNVMYGKCVVRIDPNNRILHMRDGSQIPYTTVLNSLPLHETLQMARLDPGSAGDPWTSVLVLNAAATRGAYCPDAHWVYTPHNKPGFHRVGFYDNVDPEFLPVSERGKKRITSLYIEKAFPAGTILTERDIAEISQSMLEQLREWGYIEQVLIADPTLIPVAYTWRTPGSTWREDAIALLESCGIIQMGRYGRWQFQGIAASFREGMATARRLTDAHSATGI